MCLNGQCALTYTFDEGLSYLSSELVSGMKNKIKSNVKIAVNILTDDKQNINSLAYEITFELESNLSKLENITLCNRDDLDKAIKELKFQNINNRSVDDKTVIEIGKWLGAQYIIFGSYSDWNAFIKVKLKCLEIKTGTLIYADSVKIDKNSFPEKYLENINGTIIRKQDKPSNTKKPKYSLRSKGKEIVTIKDIQEFQNEFEDNNNETITDHATGLIWEKSGSYDQIEYNKTKDYIKMLNDEKFAGYDDWRVPTMPELTTLMESFEENDFYIDPVFVKKQDRCWSADKASSGRAWYVDFDNGRVKSYDVDYNLYVRGVRSDND